MIPLCELPPGPGQAPVRKFLADTFAAHPLSHWEAFLAPLDVCWAPVKDLHEALQSPQLAAREMRIEFKPGQDPATRMTVLGIPIKFRAEPGAVVAQLPALGEHTDEVLTEAGLSADEIRKLL